MKSPGLIRKLLVQFTFSNTFLRSYRVRWPWVYGVCIYILISCQEKHLLYSLFIRLIASRFSDSIILM